MSGFLERARPGLWSALVLLSACGGESSGPSDDTRNVSIQAGSNQTATAGTAVATPPSVKVANGAGTGVSGVAVTFAVASGGGTITGATQTTNAQGIATVGGWTLGETAGANTLTATAIGASSPVTITATATAGPAAAMVKSAGDNQTAPAKAAVTTRPAVRVNDQFGNPVSGAAVVYTVTAGGGTVTGGSQTTDAQGVATVGGWTLGPTHGPNQLSAAVGGVAAIPPQVFNATGQEIVLQPSKDTTFQAGTINTTRLVIPAGRTVTVAGDVVINADSTVEIAGTLQGACVSIALTGEQTVTISGTVKSECLTAPTSLPEVTIVGKGGYLVTETAEIRANGNLSISNDPALAAAGVRGASRALGGPRARGIGGAVSMVGGPPCQVFADVTVLAHLVPQAAGTPALSLSCDGDLELGAGGKLEGADPPAEPKQTHTGNPARAVGGDGKPGGKVELKITGKLTLSGPFTIRGGNGAAGGDGEATGEAGVPGQQAASATAFGGVGGSAGMIVVDVPNVDGEANLTLIPGSGGKGGDATTTGANGEPGKATGNGTRAQDGGEATAHAAPGGELAIQVAPAGVQRQPGAKPGPGGAATAIGGAGANGSDDRVDGGNGGKMIAVGGNGGEGSGLIPGGNGGSATFDNGRGGHGWNNCSGPPFGDRGGDGGKGGDVAGGGGFAGSGGGNPGPVTINRAGNGGDGGDDATAPGIAGEPGAEFIIGAGAVTTVAPSLQPGQQGGFCQPQNLLIETGAIVFVKDHDVGESSCPDLFPDNTVTNVAGVPIVLQLSQAQGPPLLNFQILSGSLGTGGSTTIKSSFNCGQARSFTAQLVLHATGTLPGGSAGAGRSAGRAAQAETVQDVTITYTVTALAPAVKLAHALGQFPVNQVIFLGSITGYTRSAAHGASCTVEHLHGSSAAGISIQGTGPFADPDPTGCGYGEVVKQALPPL